MRRSGVQSPPGAMGNFFSSSFSFLSIIKQTIRNPKLPDLFIFCFISILIKIDPSQRQAARFVFDCKFVTYQNILYFFRDPFLPQRDATPNVVFVLLVNCLIYYSQVI